MVVRLVYKEEKHLNSKLNGIRERERERGRGRGREGEQKFWLVAFQSSTSNVLKTQIYMLEYNLIILE